MLIITGVSGWGRLLIRLIDGLNNNNVADKPESRDLQVN